MIDIAFVSNTHRVQRPFFDPSTRYRAFAPADYFRRQGKRTTCVSQKVFEENAEAFASTPVIVFHRPSGSETMLRYVTRNRKKQTLIADYDDLVFDVEASGQTPAVQDRGENPTHIARIIAAKAEIGELFEHKTASTVPLAEAADRVLGGKTLVIHNTLDPTYRSVATALTQSAKPAPQFDLGYFSGTASHNRDLRLVAPQLAVYLGQNRTRRLLLVGPVELPAALEPFSDRVTRRAVVSYYDMPLDIVACRMVLGPLLENPFALCKSGLKFFEAAVLGTHVAATPIPDIDRFESPLLHKCRTPEDWLAAFSAPPLDKPAQEAARASVDVEVSQEPQMTTWASAFLGKT